ncbi:hypothetical protein ACFL54_05615 [Planctomycetota bacterium]
MSAKWKMLILSLMICLLARIAASTAEDNSRKIMPKWRIKFWGSDEKGLSYAQAQGKFGIVYLTPLSDKMHDPDSPDGFDLTNFFAYAYSVAEERFLKYGLYYQVMTVPPAEGWEYRGELHKLLEKYSIAGPVARVESAVFLKLKLIHPTSGMMRGGMFLVDPYGRIAAQLPDKCPIKDFPLLPYEQMSREIAEYWLDKNATEIEEAHANFKRKKWPEAYAVYKPLADKVKAVEAGKEIATRVEKMENNIRDAILERMIKLNKSNITKCMGPMKKAIRTYKDTWLAEDSSRQMAVLQIAKKDAELLDLIRLNAANTLARLGRAKDAGTIYKNLLDNHAEDENILAALNLRLKGEIRLEEKHLLDPHAGPAAWVAKAGEFFNKAESKIAKGTLAASQRPEALACLLSSAEHYTAAITYSENELPGLRDKLKTVRVKLSWITSQE